jgi:hypothetical protein
VTEHNGPLTAEDLLTIEQLVMTQAIMCSLLSAGRFAIKLPTEVWKLIFDHNNIAILSR